jgi:hypothetical protein
MVAKPHLALTSEQHAVAKMLKERHGLKWPFAAIIARDVTELKVVDGSLTLPFDPEQRMRKRKGPPVRYNTEEAKQALEDWRNGGLPP